MTEKISAETRSRMMSGIRSRNTKPELLVRSFLHGKGFRFRICRNGLPGKPDIVLTRWRVVVFVHGCFWHGHAGCRYFRVPKTRPDFWEQKIARNSARDLTAAGELERMGWRVAWVWECALRDDPAGALHRLAEFIRSDVQWIEISFRKAT